MIILKNIAILLFALPLTGLAQRQITGLTLDAETADPLPYANIAAPQRSVGTVSNSEGFFVLDSRRLKDQDTVLFSYIGYETLKIPLSDLRRKTKVYLSPAPINLDEVRVLSGTFTAEEIISLIQEHYDRNYPAPAQKRRVFFHKFEKTAFPEKNRIEVKKSDFPGMDKAAAEEFLGLLPNEFVEYQDAVADLYSLGENRKLVPVEAVSLEEGSMEAIGKELERRLTVLLDDIEQSKGAEDVFYKFRTGIFSVKIESGHESDSVWIKQKNDSLNYIAPTRDVRDEIHSLIAGFTGIDSKNWEFINKPHRYEYVLEDPVMFNNELVYQIAFSPGKSAKNKGLFNGVMYVSTDSYAVVQLDFAFAEGKSTDNVQLFGLGHSTYFRRGRVIFEKGDDGYFLKYIHAQQKENAVFHRQFSILKKRKRALFNKTLSEIKIDARLFFDISGSRELLILSREGIDETDFEQASQPATMKFRKEYAYTPEMWESGTVIAPDSELKKYKRK